VSVLERMREAEARLGGHGAAEPESSLGILGRLKQAQARLAEDDADPWRTKLEAAVRGTEAISSAALLDLLRVPATTGTARRLAKIMRQLGFIPIKSRRLMPGGFRDTVTRGWARPVREARLQGTKVKIDGHEGNCPRPGDKVR
jgi:hypothetical protein